MLWERQRPTGALHISSCSDLVVNRMTCSLPETDEYSEGGEKGWVEECPSRRQFDSAVNASECPAIHAGALPVRKSTRATKLYNYRGELRDMSGAERA